MAELSGMPTPTSPSSGVSVASSSGGGVFAGTSAASAVPSGRTGFSSAVGASAFPQCDLALVIVEARYERVHAALMMAATACAMGQSVVLFGMGAGVAAFCTKWNGLEDPQHEDLRKAVGVAGLEDLRTALLDMDATLMVCDSGLKTMGLSAEALEHAVAVVGLPTFLDRAGPARVAVF
nr:DsrE family protein [uncultured Acetobacter sp.]